MNRSVMAVVSFCAVLVFGQSCSCGAEAVDLGQDAGTTAPSSGGGGSLLDAGLDDGGMPTGDDGGDPSGNDGGCSSVGTTCASAGECCSGVCDNGICTQNTFCKGAGESCASGVECCTNLCTNGTCSESQCRDVGQSCTTSDDCCTRNCQSGQCQEIPGTTFTCKVLGQACAAGSECCSTLCRNGACEAAYSCQANGDVCSRDSDCCGNACSVEDGGSGYCIFATGGGAGGCLQDGNPCPGGGENCCSRTCVDLGSGVPVCAPATGCEVTGNFCSATSDCCGGAPNPNGTVLCDSATSRCNLGVSCSPPGTICGNAPLPDGGILSVNANVNCCTGTSPPVDTVNLCKLDSSGIPRCFGGKSTQCPTGYTGEAPCCIAEGQQCQFKDQCCDGAPCIPAPDGVGFVCGSPATCAALGETCTPSSDAGSECCPGSVCGQTGEFGFACQLPRDGGTGGGTDGGTSDGGTACKANGSTCSVSGECCSGICSGGFCQEPATCQVQDAPCTASADCCSGLQCAIPSGSTSGTCQPSSCANAGQTCSPTQPCCSGLNCLNGQGVTCDGTTSCSCQVVIN